MNKTKGIFIGAALLALTALLLALKAGGPPAPETPRPTTNDGPVSLAGQVSHSHLQMNGPGELYLDIGLRGAASAPTKRVPLNVALVIDRSGSMAGDKLAHARSAARGFVQRMKAGDHIAVVSYGSDVDVLVTSTRLSEATRSSVLSAIDAIVDRGGTFLSGGLEAGRQQVLQHLDPEQVGRVILISDGEANEGITTSRGLSDLARETAGRGVSVTTVGVGLNFNEDVMTAMAEGGSGHYYFVNDASAMDAIFSKELDILQATVAKKPRLTIDLAPGVDLVTVFGYEFERVGQRVEVSLPDVYSEQDRKVICKLHVPTARAAELPVAEVALSYVDVQSGRPTEARVATRVVVTEDAASVAAGEQREVLGRVAQAEVATHINRAMGDYASGNVAAAQDQLRQTITRTERLNTRLKSGALNVALRDLKKQLRVSAEAAPSSSGGRALVKQSKANAYDMAK